jgi:CRISPR-associated protein Csx10
MHKLRYKITSLAPLLISARYGDMNTVGTLQYIPGTSVLGMFAATYIKQKKINSNAHLNDEFYSYFLKGDVRFGNAYMALTDESGNESVYYPIPVSIREEKTARQIYDLLLLDEDGEDPDKQTKTKTGFCRLEQDTIGFAEVRTDLNFHHARDPQKGTSKEGQIFNYESITKGQVFHGVITGSLEKLKKLADTCGRSWTGYIGRSKNAQYGKVSFEVRDQAPTPVCHKIKAKGEISLTFLSDTILYNENGFASTDINVLEQYLGVNIKKAFIRQDDAETFVSIWRFKKPSEACFKAGSCFLLENVTEAGRARLEEFQKTGIGERTHEGFGQFMMGWQAEDKLFKKDLKTMRAQKPDGNIPQKTKDILKILIQNAVQKQVALDAMLDVILFKSDKNNKLPSNSLIGRLHAMAGQLDQLAFIDSVKNLRKSANEQLESCRSKERKQTLLDFLKSKKVSASDAFQKPNLVDLTTLCQEIGYSPEKDSGFEKVLHHAYFTTFFSMMRKATKAREAQNE